MWYQLATFFDNGVYKAVHGFDSSIPNGIVGVGQLLPDVKKRNAYNEKLLYLKKHFLTMSSSAHPQNSYLEELNSTENINKIFPKVDQFISYYSNITGNNGSNNIYDIELGDNDKKITS